MKLFIMTCSLALTVLLLALFYPRTHAKPPHPPVNSSQNTATDIKLFDPNTSQWVMLNIFVDDSTIVELNYTYYIKRSKAETENQPAVMLARLMADYLRREGLKCVSQTIQKDCILPTSVNRSIRKRVEFFISGDSVYDEEKEQYLKQIGTLHIRIYSDGFQKWAVINNPDLNELLGTANDMVKYLTTAEKQI